MNNLMTGFFNEEKSSISFSIKYLLFKNLIGKFNKFSGTLQINSEEPYKSQMSIKIGVDSISTGEPILDNLLRKLFGAETHEEIIFVSKKVEETNDPSLMKVSGDLQIKGTTKEESFFVKIYDYGSNPPHALASATINRNQYGLDTSSSPLMKTFFIQENVEIQAHITVEYI